MTSNDQLLTDVAALVAGKVQSLQGPHGRLAVGAERLTVTIAPDIDPSWVLDAIRPLTAAATDTPCESGSDGAASWTIGVLIAPDLLQQLDLAGIGPLPTTPEGQLTVVGSHRRVVLRGDDRGLRWLTYLDVARRHAAVVAREPASFRALEAMRPLLAVISHVAEAGGLQVAHSAAVADARGRAVLICGPGGAGKSTMSVTLAGQRGLRLVGDDYVLLDPRTRSVAPIFNSIRLWPDMVDRAAHLTTRPWVTWCGKPSAVIDAHVASSPARVVGIVVPLDGQQPRAGSAMGALRAIAPSTIAMLSTDPRRTLALLASFVAGLPTAYVDRSGNAAAVVEGMLRGEH